MEELSEEGNFTFEESEIDEQEDYIDERASQPGPDEYHQDQPNHTPSIDRALLKQDARGYKNNRQVSFETPTRDPFTGTKLSFASFKK